MVVRHLFYPPPLSPHPTISHFFWGTLYIGRLMDGQIILYSLKLEFKVVQSHCPVSQRERRHEKKLLFFWILSEFPALLPSLSQIWTKSKRAAFFFATHSQTRSIICTRNRAQRVSCLLFLERKSLWRSPWWDRQLSGLRRGRPSQAPGGQKLQNPNRRGVF